ncbi:MAG: hypothetical protein WC175_03490 [Candidatus Dojkabacteria bacterium]
MSWYREKYLKSNDWKQRREKLIKGRKRFCFCCKGYGSDIHHCNYANLKKEKRKDIVILCRECHERVHEIVEKGALLKKAHFILKARINKSGNRRRGEPIINPIDSWVKASHIKIV